jgi:predicted transcriptional regulator
MPSQRVTIRLDQELHNTIKALAKAENKTVAELVRELMEMSLQRKQTEFQQVMDRLTAIEMNIEGLLMKAVVAGAEAKYYGQVNTSYASDITSFLTTNQLADSQTKEQISSQTALAARKYAEEFLLSREAPPE